MVYFYCKNREANRSERITAKGDKMLKLKVIEYKKNNHWYFDFVDEFNGESWNGRTFNTLDEAVSYARENIIDHKNRPFDLFSICKPEYTIESR